MTPFSILTVTFAFLFLFGCNSHEPLQMSQGFENNRGYSLQFNNRIDPLVKPGEKISVSFSLSTDQDPIKTLTYAFSSDGSSYGAETPIEPRTAVLSIEIPKNMPKTTNARLRLKAKRNSGQVLTVVSDPIQVIRSYTRLAIPNVLKFDGHNDGPATDARFSAVRGMVSDGTYLYVSDFCTIRRIRISDGYTETIAGAHGVTETRDGKGRTARFNSADYQITLLNGTLYTIDGDKHVIRAVTIQEGPDYGLVTTLAGKVGVPGFVEGVGGDVRFNTPRGITNDGTYLYIADSLNHVIRRMDPASKEVTTIAGEVGVSGNVQGVGLAARFSSPNQITYEPSTQALYVHDTGTHLIRKVTLPGLQVTLFSGASAAYAATIDGPANAAYFRASFGFCPSGGFLYFVEAQSHVVRKLSLADGSVSTVAGQPGKVGYANGPSHTALFRAPNGCVAAGGSLYISDSFNFSVRKIDLTSGDVSTFAGANGEAPGFDPNESADMSNAAYFDYTQGVVSDDGDTFYIADQFNNVIRKLVLSQNNVTTIAGTAFTVGSADGVGNAARFSGITGLAKRGNFIYIADGKNHTIRRLDLSDYSVITIAGTVGIAGSGDNVNGLSARFNSPVGIAVTQDGSALYVGDSGSRKIRKVILSGNYPVSTLAGSGTYGYVNATGTSAQFRGTNALLLANNDGTLYISDSPNHAIRALDIGTLAVTTVAGPTTNESGYVDGSSSAARFNNPRGLSLIGGKLYVADNTNQLVRTINLTSGNVTTLAGGGPITSLTEGFGQNVRVGNAVVLIAHGTDLFVASNYPTLSRIDTTTGYFATLTNRSPNGMMIGRAVNGLSNGNINNESSTHHAFSGVVVGNKIFFLDTRGTVKQCDTNGNNVQVVAGASFDSRPVDGVGTAARLGRSASQTATDGSYLYFAEYLNGTIRRMRLSDFSVTTIAGSPGALGSTDGVGSAASFNRPDGLAVEEENLYVSDSFNHTIRKISLASGTFGKVTTLAGQVGVAGSLDGVGTAASFNTPKALAVVNGALYVADSKNFVVRKIDLSTTQVTTFVGKVGQESYKNGPATEAQFSSICGITSDGVNLYVSDQSKTLRKVRLSDGMVSHFLGKPFLWRDQPSTDSFLEDENVAQCSSMYVYVKGMGLSRIQTAPVLFQ